MYDISGQLPIDKKITKAVFREKLIEALQNLGATVNIADDDGAVEFVPAPKNRGKHPLKNISIGRISLLTNGHERLYVDQIRYQISLIQMRVSLVTICLFIWAYSLFRGYGIIIPLAFTILSWVFGYLFAMRTIRSRFKELIQMLH